MRRAVIATGVAVLCALAGAETAAAAPAGGSIAVPCTGTGGGAAGLTAAVVQADQAGGPWTISLDAGCTYDFTSAYLGSDTVTGPNGEGTVGLEDWYGPSALPAIATTITIEGNGATLQATQPTSPDMVAGAGYNPDFRFFFVGADPNASATAGYVTPGAGSLTLRDLTLAGGEAHGGSGVVEGGGGAGMGGAIFDQGTVSLQAVTATDDVAQGGDDGDMSGYVTGGGGIGSDGTTSGGGGFGPGSFGGAAGGAGGTSGTGGGAGFVVGEAGAAATSVGGGAGGGPDTGLGAAGDPDHAAGGDGSAGGQNSGGAAGGAFGQGGIGAAGTTGGGGGVGGGGGEEGSGGFGAGGDSGGDGGFGGGGGGIPETAGFGGADGHDANGGGGAGMGGVVFDMQGTVAVENSTLTGDSAIGGPDGASGLGGAIFNLNGSVTVSSSTIDGNTAAQGGAGIYDLGYDSITARAASLTLSDSIVDGDATTDLVANAPSATAAPTANMSTVAADADSANIVGSSSGPVSGSPSTGDPKLGALSVNGGPGMATQLPGAGSAALGAGVNCPAVDERGIARPADGCDLGAVEVSPTVTIDTPASGAAYVQGQAVAADFSCADPGGPGIASCDGPVADGAALDTSRVGTHTFAVTATSQDGLTTTRSVAYAVTAASAVTTSTTTTTSTPPTAPTSTSPVASAATAPGRAGLVYRLSAAGSRSGGSPITGYRWTLDGRVIGRRAVINHAFPRAGRYTVVLVVTDASGATTTLDVPVVVRARTVTTRATVHFRVDRAGLDPSDRRAIAALRAAYGAASRVQIVGYCAGREAHDSAALRRLSRDRARMVLALLRAHHNRSHAHTTVRGLGAVHFVAANGSAAGRARNRRATVMIVYRRPLG